MANKKKKYFRVSHGEIATQAGQPPISVLMPYPWLQSLAQRGEIVLTIYNDVIVPASAPYEAIMKVYNQYIGRYPRVISIQEMRQGTPYYINVTEMDNDFRPKMTRKGSIEHFYTI